MIYGWTPETCLQMRAQLFFSMLASGRSIERRRNFRSFYELCRVAMAPHMSDSTRTEVAQYYFDGSLSSFESAQRDAVIEQVNRDAAKTWAKPSAALDFFRGARP